MKLYVRGFSQYKNKIYDKLSNASEQIDEHIIRLLLYSNDSHVNHWMNEIWSFLYKVDKLKGKNKWPSEKFIYDAISCHNDIIDALVVGVKDKEANLFPNNISYSRILSALEEYQRWLAVNLSKYGQVAQADVKYELTNIMNDHGLRNNG